MDDGRLQGQLNQIKALIASVASKVGASATTALPTVDFCCDMFDRKDSDVLNGYWQTGATAYSLRSGKVIQQSPVGTSSAFDVAGSHNDTLNSYSGTFDLSKEQGDYYSLDRTSTAAFIPNSTPDTSTPKLGAAVDYAAAISAPDMTVKLVFEVSTTSAAEDTSAPGLINRVSARHHGLSQPFGVRFSSPAASIGVFGIAAQIGGTSVPALSSTFSFTGPSESGSVTALGISTPAGMLFSGAFTDFLTTAVLLTGSPGSSGYSATDGGGTVVLPSGRQLSWSNNANTTLDYSVANAVHTGANILLVTASGTTYTVTLNGTVIYTGTSARLLNRSSVGMVQPIINTLGYLLSWNLPYTGITSFKAWVAGTSEPPDQSGHGTIVSGARVYTDKYHDKNGAYNPLA